MHLSGECILRLVFHSIDLMLQATGLSASFGEMLLLMAIHFHSNQLSAIGDLVCQTLGMKIVIRTNSMSRKISHVFTHEIFNEQV